MSYKKPFKLIGNLDKVKYDIFDADGTLVLTAYDVEFAMKLVDSFNGYSVADGSTNN